MKRQSTKSNGGSHKKRKLTTSENGEEGTSSDSTAKAPAQSILSFVKGQVVLASFDCRKRFKWPAVVSAVYPRARTVSVIYLPQVLPFGKPLRGTKLPLKKVAQYDGHAVWNDAAKHTSDHPTYLNALLQADEILEKNLDVFSVDDLNEPTLVKSNSSASLRCSALVGEEDVERSEKTQLLLQHLGSEPVQTYLDDLMSNSIPSKRRDEFFQLVRTGRLSQRTLQAGPFNSKNELVEAFEILLPLCQKHGDLDLHGSNLDSFVESVLFPEGVVFALQHFWSVDAEKAEQILIGEYGLDDTVLA